MQAFHQRADELENAQRPIVAVQPQSLEFHRCIPLVSAHKSIRVQNGGSRDAHVSVAVLEAPWLDVQPRVCVIEPGASHELSVRVTMSAFLGDDDGDDANDSKSDTDAEASDERAIVSRNTVLVLHTRGGGCVWAAQFFRLVSTFLHLVFHSFGPSLYSFVSSLLCSFLLLLTLRQRPLCFDICRAGAGRAVVALAVARC